MKQLTHLDRNIRQSCVCEIDQSNVAGEVLAEQDVCAAGQLQHGAEARCASHILASSKTRFSVTADSTASGHGLGCYPVEEV